MSAGVVIAGVGVSCLLCFIQCLILAIERRRADGEVSVGSEGSRGSRMFMGSVAVLVGSGMVEKILQMSIVPAIFIPFVQNLSLVLEPLIFWGIAHTQYNRMLLLGSLGILVSGAAILPLGFEKDVYLTYRAAELLRLAEHRAVRGWLWFTFGFTGVTLGVNALLGEDQENGSSRINNIKGASCFVASGFISGHMLMLVKCMVMVIERAVFVDKNFVKAISNWQFWLFFVLIFILGIMYVFLLFYGLRLWNPFTMKSIILSVTAFTVLVESVLIFHQESGVSLTRIFPMILVFSTSVFVLSYLEQNHRLLMDEANPLEPNRTTTLSYASLRPLSMYSTTSLSHDRPSDSRQSIVVDEANSDSNYVSFHRSSESDSNMNGPNRKRRLSFEQEELLAHLAS